MSFLSPTIFVFICLVFTHAENVSKTSAVGNDDTVMAESQLVWPLSNSKVNYDFPLSSPYGPRLQASMGFIYDFHRGIDIPTRSGTNIHAVQGGTIAAAGLDNGDLRIVLKV